MPSCKNDPGKPSGKSEARKNQTSSDLGDLYAGYYNNPATLAEKEQNTIIEYATEKELPLERTESGLYFMLTDRGMGPALQWGEKVKVHYRGYFLDGKEFDSSYDRDKPIIFKVGQMIPGWNEALRKMASGSKATIIVPSRLGYADKGFPGAVPPNTIIAFDIHVLI